MTIMRQIVTIITVISFII